MRAVEWASNAAPRMTAMLNPLKQLVAQFYRREKFSTAAAKNSRDVL
jgi:hypothetical protein